MAFAIASASARNRFWTKAIRLCCAILRGPDPDRDGVSAWRLIDICRLCEERLGVTYSVSGMFDLLKGLDLRWQKSWPRHPQAGATAQKAFKKGGSPKP